MTESQMAMIGFILAVIGFPISLVGVFLDLYPSARFWLLRKVGLPADYFDPVDETRPE